MKGEIDKDFYCSTAGKYDCPEKGNCAGCPDRHRKHPTPEQFKEEYGKEWTGAMYTKCFAEFCKLVNCIYQEWTDFPDFTHPDDCKRRLVKVCACTPFGKPDDDWRPK